MARPVLRHLFALISSSFFLAFSGPALATGPVRTAVVGSAPASSVRPIDPRIDPTLRLLIRDHEDQGPLAWALPSEGSTPLIRTELLATGELAAAVLVRSTDVRKTVAAIEGRGGYVRLVVGEVVVGVVPVAGLEAVAQSPEVASVEASYFATRLLDASRPATKADLVQAGSGLSSPRTGAGVVVGIVDTGIDYTRPDFKTASGATRIRSIWDISGVASGGSARTCSSSSIEAGTCSEKDLDGHGTHVSGTAVGNGRTQTGFIGMAPEADIIFAKATRSTTADSSFANDDVIAAATYIFDQAQALGKPAVVNMSLGGIYGRPMDGTSSYEQALSSLTGPGRVIVAAAGNDGSNRVHLSYTASGSGFADSQETQWIAASDNSTGRVSLWYDSGSISVGIGARTSSTQETGIVISAPIGPGGSTGGTVDLKDGSGTVLARISIDATTTSYSTNGARVVTISLQPVVSRYFSLYTFGTGTFDAWASNMTFGSRSESYWRPGDSTHTVGSPASAKKVIAVANYVTKTQYVDVNGTSRTWGTCSAGTVNTIGDIACTSSMGPTRDGRTKPEIAAPGRAIASDLSVDAVPNQASTSIMQGGKLLMESGTSMASPHVAGIVALMLQSKPDLTFETALQTLQGTAVKDSYTGSSANNTWGAGKVDALAAVKAVTPAPAADFGIAASPASLSVAAGAGASVQVSTTTSGGFSAGVALSASGLPSGASASFSPPTISAPGAGSSTLTLSTSSSTPAGSYTVSVTGTGGGKTHQATVSLSVTSGGGGGGSTVVKIVPIVLDVAGVGSSRYGSELTLANRGSTAATVQLAYTAASAISGAGSGSVPVSLGAGRQLVIPDAISYLRSHGLAIPADGSGQGGTIRATFAGLSSSNAAFAGARTTTPSGSGRAGLSYPAVRPEECFTDKAWIYGLRQSSADRSNLALLNAGTSSSVTLRVTVWNQDASEAYYLTPDFTLGPGQWTQISRILDIVGFSAGYARVDRVSGAGPFYVYGVFNDSRTNDGSYVAPLPDSYSFETSTLPVLVETSTFSSELVLVNYTSSPASVSLDYVESLTPSAGVGGTVTELLAPLQQKIIPDAIQYLRSKGISLEPKGSASFAGALRATFRVGGSLDGGFVGARTGAPAGGGGQYGLFYSGMGPSTAASSEAWVFGLQENSSVRSNLAIVNLGDAGSITFRVEVFDGDTGLKAGTSVDYTLAAGGWTQFSAVLPIFGASNGFVRVVRVSGSSRFLSYGVVNDGATSTSGATNDGSFMIFVNQ